MSAGEHNEHKRRETKAMRTELLRRRSWTTTPRLLGLAAAAASLLTLGTASAQVRSAPPPVSPVGEGFALNQFEPAPAGDHFFGVPDAVAATGEGKTYKPNVMLLGSYA